MAKKRIMWMLGATLSGGAAAQKPSPKTDSATETITLRVIDGDTGLPMRSPKLELGCRTATGQRCSAQRRVENSSERQQGVLKFEVSADAAAIYEASSKLDDCNLWSAPRADELPVSTARGGISVARILRNGLALQNACRVNEKGDAATTNAIPGEVVMFYRRGARNRAHSAL